MLHRSSRAFALATRSSVFNSQTNNVQLNSTLITHHENLGLPSSSVTPSSSTSKFLQDLFPFPPLQGEEEGRVPPKIYAYNSVDSVDQAKLTHLLEQSFGKNLSASYFEKLQRTPHRVYVVDDYEGCAILTHNKSGVPYLCKFAVSPDAQGQGLAGVMWRRIKKENPDMFWRSRKENPVNPWYQKKSSGSETQGRWTVFWYGSKANTLEDFYKDYSLAITPTFKLN